MFFSLEDSARHPDLHLDSQNGSLLSVSGGESIRTHDAADKTIGHVKACWSGPSMLEAGRRQHRDADHVCCESLVSAEPALTSFLRHPISIMRLHLW